MPKPKTFYIIDGHAQIYRAYFAPFRDLTSPNGEPTKATFVFTQMLINLIQQRKPDYLAMVIDAGDERTFRKQMYPEYKANRKAAPDDFHPQEQRILQIVRDAGVPIFEKPGFEADDLIATMAHQLCDADYEIFLVSKDKDLRQILNDCTHLYDVHSDEIMNVEKMQAKLGYSPSQAVDVQTLMGDAIDNVPGVPGVGEKTAAKLINQYGSAEAIFNHLDELSPKLRENVAAFAEKMPMSRKLVTLEKNVDFDFDPASCKFTGLNTEALRVHLEALGFRSLLSRIGINDAKPGKSVALAAPKYQPFGESLFPEANAPVADDPDAPPSAQTHLGCKYTLIDTDAKFEDFLTQLKSQSIIAIDTETDSLDPLQSKLVGLSFSWKSACGFYVPVRGPVGCECLDCDHVLDAVRPILENPQIKKVGHNLKFDLMVLRQNGINVRGIELDTMVGAFLIDASRLKYGIDQLAIDLLNYRKIETTELIGKGKAQLSMDRVPLEKVALYASEDADITFRLAEGLTKQLNESPQLRKLNDEVETPLINVLVEMEENGIAVDPQILKEQSLVLGEKIEIIRAKIFTEAGGAEFNPDSPKQLADVLFNRLGLKVIKRSKTGPSTDIEVLEKLSNAHPVPKLILEYRSMMKLKNTYLDNLTSYVNPKTGRIHANFNQIGAATGRLSCSDPNLQNIPIRTDEGRRIRSAFVPGDPEKNVLLTADYSQIELRILAHFTGEPSLVAAFANDEDVHRTVAAEVFAVAPEEVTREQRGQAKIVNFGIVYGVSAYGLARRIDGMSVGAAAELISAYHKKFPRIKQFLEQCVMEAQTKGFVETIMGRRRPIIEIDSKIISMRNAAERIAINSVVQGSAADLIKIAMNNVYKRLKRDNLPSKMLLQVHDELVFETPIVAAETDAAAIREEMIGAMKLDVPLKVEVGWAKNWQEVK